MRAVALTYLGYYKLPPYDNLGLAFYRSCEAALRGHRGVATPLPERRLLRRRDCYATLAMTGAGAWLRRWAQ